MPQEIRTVSKRRVFSLVNAPYTGVLDCGVLCFGEKVEHHSPHFMVWGAMYSEHLFKSCFFDGLVNHLNSLALLENWLIQQLPALGLKAMTGFNKIGPQIFVQ